MNKYEKLIELVKQAPRQSTIVVMVDYLDRVQKFVDDLIPILRKNNLEYRLLGQSHQIYIFNYASAIKFCTVDTIAILPAMFFTEAEANGKTNPISTKDINPYILLDLEDIPEMSFGQPVTYADVMATFELLKYSREKRGKAISYVVEAKTIGDLNKLGINL